MENGVILIATASASAPSGPCAIKLWQWKLKEEDREEVAWEGWTFCEVLGFLVKLVVAFAAIAYVVELGKQAICKLYFLSCLSLIFAKTGNWAVFEPQVLAVKENATVVAQNMQY